MITTHQCCVVNEQGQYYRCNGTWGPYGPLVLMFPDKASALLYSRHSGRACNVRFPH